MKNPSHKLFFFLAFLVLASFSIPTQEALAADSPILTDVASDPAGAEGTTTCSFDLDVAAGSDLIVVAVTTDDSNGISVADEDLQTYTLRTDSTASGSGNQYSYIYTSTSPATNAANTVTVTFDNGDMHCFGLVFSSVNTTTPVEGSDSSRTTAGSDSTASINFDDNSMMVEVCGNLNTSTFTMETDSTTQASESNGGANKFAAAVATLSQVTQISEPVDCNPSKSGDMSLSAIEIQGDPSAKYVVDLLDVYESASTTLGAGTAVCLDVDLETASDCNGITTKSVVDATSISGQEADPRSMEFSTDGSKLFIIGEAGDDVNEYSCSTSWDMSSCTFTDATSISGQQDTPTGIAFSVDGIKMFISGRGLSNDSVDEYTLSTAFDASTRTAVDDFTLSDSEPYDVEWSTDGTRMYNVGNGDDTIDQYICSPWDLSTCILDDSFDHSGEQTNAWGLEFTNDGKNMFITGNTALSGVNQYYLVIPWDVTTAVHVVEESVVSEEGSPRDVFISPDKTKMFILGDTGDDVTEYDLDAPLKVNTSYRFEVEVDNTGDLAGSPNLLTVLDSLGKPWDSSSIKFVDHFDINPQEATASGITFSNDGTKMFLVGQTGDDVNEYDCDSFDSSSCSFVDATSVATNSLDPESIKFSFDGKKMYILQDNGAIEEIDEYTCTTAWDASTCTTFVDSLDVGNENTSPSDLRFKPDGTKLWVLGQAGNDEVNEYNCPIAWDVSACVFTEFLDVNTETPILSGIDWFHDGTIMFLVGADIDEYVCTTPWFATSCVYNDFADLTDSPTPRDLHFSPDGKKLFVVEPNNDEVDEYTVGGLFGDVPSSYTESMVFVDALSTTSQDTNMQDITWSSDGTKMYGMGDSDNAIVEYGCTAWDLSTCTDNSSDLAVGGQETIPTDLAWEDDGTRVLVLGDSGNVVDEWGSCTAWDVSTCSFVDSLDISSQITDPKGMDFSSDGTVLIVAEAGTANDITEYTCTTGWDMSTCTYVTSSELDISGETTQPEDVLFVNEGYNILVVSDSPEQIFEYECTTQYDVSTCTPYDNSFLGFADGITLPTGIAIAGDLSRIYISEENPDNMLEYTITLPSPTSGCSTNTDWESHGILGGDLGFRSGTTCSISASGNAEFWFLMTMDGESRNDDVSFSITDGTNSDSSTVTGIEVTKPIFHFNEMDVYESASTTLDVGTVICINDSLNNGFCDIHDSLDVNSEETQANGMSWNNAGTKMYVVGQGGGGDITEYNCTAFEVGTCTDASSPLDTSTQDSSPSGMTWNDDGTKMYISSPAGTGDIIEYNCTAFDVSTCTDASSPLDVSAQEATPSGVIWNDDGTKVFVAGNAGEDILEYDSCTAYDVSTCSFVDSLPIDIGTPIVEGMDFSSTGEILWVVDSRTPTTLHRYSCSAFDVSTCKFTDSFDASGFESGMQGVVLSDDSLKIYFIGNDDKISEFYTTQLTEGDTYRFEVDIYNLGGITSSPDVFSMLDSVSGDLRAEFLRSEDTLGEEATSPYGMSWNDDGTKLFWVGDAGQEINEWNCDPYTLTGCSDSGSPLSLVGDGVTNPRGMAFNDDGTKMFVVDHDGNDISEYGTCTAWDVSTCSFVDALDISGQDVNPRGMKFNSDGTKMFLAGTTGQDINEYNCTAFDISTCSFVDSFSVATEAISPVGVAFNNPGTKMFVVDQNDVNIIEYDCTVFDVSTCSHASTFDINSVDAFPTGILFSPNDTKMLVAGGTNDEIYEFDVTSNNVFGSITATGSSGCSTNTNWTDSIVNEYDVQQDSGTTCSLGLGDSATYWFIVTLDDDAPIFDTASFKIDDGITAFESLKMAFTVEESMGATEYTKQITDQLSVTDLANRSAAYTKAFSDAMSIVDSVTATRVIIEAKSDPMSITDSVSRIASYTVSISDNMSITDSQTSHITHFESDPLSITDLATPTKTVIDTQSDNMSITDSQTSHITHFVSDNLSITDLVDPTATYTKPISDNMSMVDSQTSHITTFPSDQLSMTDLVDPTATYTKTISDNMSIVDSQTSHITTFPSDPMSITDNITTTRTIIKTISDPLSMTDSVATSHGRTNTESDPLSLTDNITTMVTYMVAISDNLGFTDQAHPVIRIIDGLGFTDQAHPVIHPSDNMSLTDSVTATKMVLENPSDPMSITDSVTATKMVIDTQSDPLSFTDSVTTTVIIVKNISDNLGLTDQAHPVIRIIDGLGFTDQAHPVIRIIDNLSFTDSVTETVGKINTESDPMSLVDSVTTMVTYMNQESDPLSFTDSVTATKMVIKNISDNLGFTDQAHPVIRIIDGLGFTDQAHPVIHPSDNMSLIDSVTATKMVLENPSDPMSITDSVTATKMVIDNPSDPMSIIDSVTATKMVIDNPSDPMSIIDSVTATKMVIDTQSDPMSITDSITTTHTIFNMESDPMSITDNVSRIASYTVSISDNMSLVDSHVKHITDFQSDPMSITDDMTPTCMGCGDVIKQIIDQLSIIDSQTSHVTKFPSDPLSFTDAFTTITTRNIGFTEGVDVGDDQAVDIDKFNTESDPISLIDAITLIVNRYFNPADQLSFTDSITATNGTTIHFINATEGVDVNDLVSDVSIFVYEPTGKVIWFKVAPPTNSTAGGIFQTMCDTSEIVTGVNGTGYLKCTLLHAPTTTERGGVFQQNCPAGEYVSGIDSNGDLVCSDPTP